MLLDGLSCLFSFNHHQNRLRCEQVEVVSEPRGPRGQKVHTQAVVSPWLGVLFDAGQMATAWRSTSLEPACLIRRARPDCAAVKEACGRPGGVDAAAPWMCSGDQVVFPWCPSGGEEPSFFALPGALMWRDAAPARCAARVDQIPPQAVSVACRMAPRPQGDRAAVDSSGGC